MIVVQLIGGLGNQLFQYALGKRLALHHNTELKLDISSFQTFYKLHKYSLFHFNVKENFITPQEAKKYKNLFSRTFAKVNQMSGNKLAPYYSQRYVKEQSFLYDANILKVPSDVYMDGFWQTEKYFTEIGQELRKDFAFKTPPSDDNSRVADEIQNTGSVSLHIRRSDYVTDAKSNQVHGACGLDYYKKAIDFITERVENPKFFVFSDDMEWTKSNLLLNFPAQYVDFNNADANYEDLRLMSLCKHNIAANSTFSWWGAWLNANPGKVIMVPEKWFNSSERNSGDLIPEGWTKL